MSCRLVAMGPFWLMDIFCSSCKALLKYENFTHKSVTDHFSKSKDLEAAGVTFACQSLVTADWHLSAFNEAQNLATSSISCPLSMQFTTMLVQNSDCLDPNPNPYTHELCDLRQAIHSLCYSVPSFRKGKQC